MSGRGRALRSGVAFDQRDGFKVRGRKLVEDGERPGVWVSRSNADQAHPQRYVRVPPPDGLSYRPGPPAAHSIGAKVDLSWVMASDTHTVGGGMTQQPEPVLQRRASPTMAWTGFNSGNFFVGQVPIQNGGIIWGGTPLQFGAIDLIWEESLSSDVIAWGGLELQWGGGDIVWDMPP